MNAIVETQAKNSRPDVYSPIPLYDADRFAHMQRIASIMAAASLIPDSLRTTGTKNNKVDLAPEQVLANCFLIVNQSERWGMDPFAVAQCVSVVHGKLCYEGKLVAAVLEAKLGIELEYAWNDHKGDAFGIVVSGRLPDGRVKTVQGTVGDWKTTGDGSPWLKMPRMMLAYRGAREWARLHAPAIMLGVYTPDELDELQDNARAARATQVGGSGLAARLTGQGGAGFSAAGVEAALAEAVDPNTGEVLERAATTVEAKQEAKAEPERQPAAAKQQDPAPAMPTQAAVKEEAVSPTAASSTPEHAAATTASGAAKQVTSSDAGPSLARRFHKALLTAQDDKALSKASNQFWDINLKPEKGTFEYDECRDIRNLHDQRVAGEIEENEFNRHIAGILGAES